MGGKHGQIRAGSKQDGQERNATEKTWNVAIGKRRKRRSRQEQKAGDRHWIVGSTKERRKGSEKNV
jgi:hypothetical protein